MTSSSPSLAPGKPCPLCGKPAVDKYKPFCSSRCADVDLNRWLSGVYSIPVKDEDGEEGAKEAIKPRDRAEDEPS